MTDMLAGRLLQGTGTAHNVRTLSIRVALCPPPPVARGLSNPSWKVIVSASRGQYLKPGSFEPGFFLGRRPRVRTGGKAAAQSRAVMHEAAPIPRVDRPGAVHHPRAMDRNRRIAASSKKAPHPGASDRRAR